MSKVEKLKERLLSIPSDFTWDELKKILVSFGFHESNMGKTSGSRVRFISDEYAPILLHKPHPKLEVKVYMLKQIIEHLKKEGLL